MSWLEVMAERLFLKAMKTARHFFFGWGRCVPVMAGVCMLVNWGQVSHFNIYLAAANEIARLWSCHSMGSSMGSGVSF